MILIAIDPSGNFEEGKGTTGAAVFVDGVLKETFTVSASGYEFAERYWAAHMRLIDHISNKYSDDFEVVCESYKLQKNKAMQQSGSWLETPQLIGYLRVAILDKYHVEVKFQDPPIKTRFSDDVLLSMGVLEKRGRSYYWKDKQVTMHERDAIRHGMYYIKYGKKG